MIIPLMNRSKEDDYLLACNSYPTTYNVKLHDSNVNSKYLGACAARDTTDFATNNSTLPNLKYMTAPFESAGIGPTSGANYIPL
jgi:hypothetical protein